MSKLLFKQIKYVSQDILFF